MSQKSLFDNSLQKTELLFRLTGINITNDKRTVKENVLFTVNFILVGIAILSAIHFVYEGLQTRDGLEELAFVTPCTILCSLASIKCFLFLLSEKKVRILISNLRALELKADQFENGTDEVVKPDIKFLNNVMKVLSVQTALMVSVFQVVPILIILVEYIITGEWKLRLQALDVYPVIDAYELRYWPFAFLHQLWAECAILVEVNSTDFFFFICCTHIRIQFKFLQRQFQEFIDRTSCLAERGDLEVARSQFKELVVWHQEILSSAKMLDGIYSKPCLWNFFLSSVIICLTGFNITILQELAFVATSIIFLSMSLLQVFFLCLFGDTLMTSSMEFSDAIYNSRWYFSDVTMKKDVLFVQMRSQESCKISAEGFAEVNLRAFMRVLNSSWSYLALLRTMFSARA